MIHYDLKGTVTCGRKIGPGTDYPHDTKTVFWSMVDCETCRVMVSLHNALYYDRCPIKVEG